MYTLGHHFYILFLICNLNLKLGCNIYNHASRKQAVFNFLKHLNDNLDRLNNAALEASAKTMQ